MKARSLKSFLSSFWPARSFTTESYPFPPGSQNRDGFERNHDNPLRMVSLSEHRVLMLSTVMACVRLISGTIATLPCHVYQRVEVAGKSTRQLAVDDPLYSLLHDSPNDDMTATSFWTATVSSMLLNGVSYGEKKLAESTGRIVSIEYLEHGRVGWEIVNGDREYHYVDPNGTRRKIPRDRLFRVLGFTLNGVDGISAIKYGAMMFHSAQLADAAANSTFRKGLFPTVAFSMDKIMRQEQREEMRAAVKKLGGALNSGEPIVLEGGMTAEALGINPDDAQLLESRAWSVEEICRWFGVPPHMVGHTKGSTSWGTGLEQQNLGFLTYCLRSHTKSIEQAVGKDLIAPNMRRRKFAEFAIDALMRADSAGRAALYGSAAQNGWMTREEIRDLENLPPVAGADKLTVQSALVNLDQLGAQSAPAADLQKSLRNFLGLIDDGPDPRKT